MPEAKGKEAIRFGPDYAPLIVWCIGCGTPQRVPYLTVDLRAPSVYLGGKCCEAEKARKGDS